MMLRKGFTFWDSYFNTMKEFPEWYQDKIWGAIVRYVYTDVIPNFDEVGDKMIQISLRAIWAGIQPNLDSSKSQKGRSTEQPTNDNQSATNLQPICNQSATNLQTISYIEEEVEVEVEEEVKEEVEDKRESVKEKRDKPLSPTPPKFDFKSELIALGVSKQTASDFMQVRKQRKAANTQTAFNRLKAEIAKAEADGVSAEDCIRMAVENSWQGFAYEWYKNRQPKNENQTDQSERPKRVNDGRVLRLMMDGVSEKEALDRVYGPVTHPQKKVVSSKDIRQQMKEMGWDN